MTIKINIFIMCYNEEVLIEKTIDYYKNKFPSSNIYIVDNCSTDKSPDIAYGKGCAIYRFESNNQQNEVQMMSIRNSVWCDVKDGWVIMCDMDEWLEINENDLEIEDSKGTTIITTKGYEMIGNSKTLDLSDINLFDINRGCYRENMSKRICFKIPDVNINFSWGSHTCNPEGNIKYSEKEYNLKHMNYLGLNYIINKYEKRYSRNDYSRSICLNEHYVLDIKIIEDSYNLLNSEAHII